MATVEELLALEVRVGTIVSARVLRGSRTPAFAVTIDFGSGGVREATASIADLYEADDIVGLQVTAVVNLPPTRVAGVESRAVVLTVDNGKDERVLLIPERPVPDGGKVG